jgi:hypothetical protein
MFLSTGTEIAEHRLHCSEAGTLVVPSSPLTDVEYREYCLYLHSLAPEQRGAWLAHPPASYNSGARPANDPASVR